MSEPTETVAPAPTLNPKASALSPVATDTDELLPVVLLLTTKAFKLLL